MRLDVFLVKKNLYPTRQKAQYAIENGHIEVNGVVVDKPSFEIIGNEQIQIIETKQYVSNAAYKLLRAIEVFSLDFSDKIVLDVGASTGGFTQCALEAGAKLVYAVDVGTNQLHSSLRDNPKIVLFENTDIRNFNVEQTFDIVLVDVSFISLTKVLPNLLKFISNKTLLLTLIKPQFELELVNSLKKSPKDKNLHLKIIEKIIFLAHKNNLYIKDFTYSPLRKKKNIEYLALWTPNISEKKVHWENTVEVAFEIYKKL